MAANQWINLATAARLLGQDIGLISKRTAEGRYGISRQGPANEVLVTLRGIGLAARRTWTDAQVEAAKANRPLPPYPDHSDAPFFLTSLNRRPRLSIDEIGAQTAIDQPME